MSLLLVIISVLIVTARPIVMLYFLLVFMFVNGLASREFMLNLRATIGSVNIFPQDAFYAAAVVLIPIWLLRRMLGARSHIHVNKEVRFLVVLASLFLFYQLIRLFAGYLAHVPLDSLVRMFSNDARIVFIFVPLLFLRNHLQLRPVLLLLVLLSLIFPFGQVLFSSHEDTATLLQGQGTLRLGFGDANILVAAGLLAIYIWESMMWLAAIPAAGVVMLAHRSAFIALFLALIASAFLKGKKIKTLFISSVGGLLVIALLFAVQHYTATAVLDKGVERIEETLSNTGTTRARVHTIPYLFGIWLDHPVTGLGYQDLYNRVDRTEKLQWGWNADPVLHPHNYVMRTLVQQGAVGLLLLLSINGYALLVSWRLSKLRGLKNTGAFLFSIQIFFLLFAMMNTSMSSAGYFYWSVIGIVFWYAGNKEAFNKGPADEKQQAPVSTARILRPKTSVRVIR